MKLIPSFLITLAMSSVAFAADAGHGEEPSVFAGTIIQSISAVIVFLVLLFVLTKFAWTPILKGLQDREAKIKDDLSKAEHAAAKAEATLKEYQAKLAQAQSDATDIVTRARQDAERESLRIQEQTRRELDTMKKQTVADIRYAKEVAINDLYRETATLSTAVAGRILGRVINADDQKSLVEQAMSELGKTVKNN